MMPRAMQRGIGGPQPPAMPRAFDPETVYRANGGKVRNYASGGDVTTQYGRGPEFNFFPGVSPLPQDQPAPEQGAGIASYAYQPSTQTTYAVVQPEPGAGVSGTGADARPGSGPGPNLSGMASGNNGAIGAIAGGLLGGPVAGLAGRGIGTGIDLMNANDRIGDFERSMGQPASSPLGVSAWGSAMLNGLTPFGDRLGVGTSVRGAERDALANAAMAAPMNNPLTNQEAALLGVSFDQSGGGHDVGFDAGDYSGADTGDYGGAGPGYNAKGGPIRAAQRGIGGPSPAVMAHAGAVKGPGDGQQDLIDAKLSDGEYVWSAQDVSDLGSGSNDEGVRRLDKMRQLVRKNAGRKNVKNIARPDPGIGHYLKEVA